MAGAPLMPEECLHGLEFGCVICRDGPSRPPPEEVVQRSTAIYRAKCLLCQEQIHEGDPIALLLRAGFWVHEECAP
jgi:hypothetical protein